MAYASKAGRARVSSSNPTAQAVCDRCGIWYSRRDLSNQVEWRGSALLPLYIYVCRTCYDVPNENVRAIIIPADPVPVTQPRTEPFTADETDYRVTAAPSLIDPVTGIPVPQGDTLLTLNGNNRTTQPLGPPAGIAQAAIPPQYKSIHYGPTLSVLSVISDGFYTVTVTCSSPHGLANNSQVSVQGLTFNGADGTYSVVVKTATAFSYTTINVTPQGSLLSGASRIWTLLAGIPRGYDEIPQTGLGK
jgi:hypothetical protein